MELYLLILAGALLATAVVLPAGPGLPLAVRYRRQAGGPAPPQSARRRLPLVPARWLLPLLPARYRRGLEATLLRAQMLESWPLPDFLALKLTLALFFALQVTLTMAPKLQSPVILLPMLLEAAGGWILPDFWAKRRAASRLAAAERELPQMLSSLAICLQTGLSLRSTLLHLAVIHPTGVLGTELRVAAAHVGAGATPSEALTALIERCRTPDLARALGSVLQQAARSPKAAGAAAAAESRQAWERRRRRSEAVAHTASLKLFFPQLLFGLPSVMLILLGPALLRLLEAIRGF
jgi:tight adherence protein C